MYTALYTLYRASAYVWSKISEMSATHIPPHLPAAAHLNWFYINTNMMLFVIIAVLCGTALAIILGKRIAKTSIGIKALFAYFALFGLIAPLWLMRAAWGTVRAQESKWR